MKTVMVVDDEPKIVQLARDYLEHAGFAVVVAHDGRAALAAARSHKPDLVVLDLGLPEIDGLELCRRVRARVDEVYVPIIMMTAMTSEQERLEGFAAGADDYVIKPFQFEELLARVQVWVRTSQRLQAAHARLVSPGLNVWRVPGAHGRSVVTALR